MVVRMLLVLLMSVGLVPAGDCMCASAHHAADVESVAISTFADLATHDHDDDHPVHHHPTCPAINPRLDLPVALAPVPFSVPGSADATLAVWGSWSPEPLPLRCRSRSTSSPSARALPLYLSQSALQI